MTMRMWMGLVAWMWLGCGGDGGESPLDASPDSGIDAASPGETVTVTLQDRSLAPTVTYFAAYQDGDQPWQHIALQGDVSRLQIHSGRYSVLFACNGGTRPTVLLYQLAVVERTQLAISLQSCGGPMPSSPGGTVRGDVSNLLADEIAHVSHGLLGEDVSNFDRYSFSTPRVTRDLVVAAGPLFPASTNRVHIVRNVDASASPSVDIDMASPTTAVTPFVHRGPATDGEALVLTAALVTMNGTNALLSRQTGVFGGFSTVPSIHLASTDVIQVAATLSASPGPTGHTRTLIQHVVDPEPISFAMPPPLTGVSATVITQIPFAQLRARWTPHPPAQLYLLTFSQAVPQSECTTLACTIEWRVMTSVSWLGTTTSYTMPEPAELLALRGWDSQLQFVGKRRVDVVVQAFGSSAGDLLSGVSNLASPEFLTAWYPSGTVIRGARAADSATP